MEERSVKRNKLSLLRADVVLIVFVLLVMLGLLLPRIQLARENARVMSCSGHLRALGLALHNYHAFHDQLPPGCGGTGPTVGQDDQSNQRRLSAFVPLTLFLEHQTLWDSISESYHSDGDRHFPAMGPAPWRASVYPPFQIGPWTYRCPSDSANRPPKHASLLNYAMCYGDGVHEVGYEPDSWLAFRSRNATTVSQRGVFCSGRARRFSDITDGLASTLAIGEVVTLNQRVPISRVIANVDGLKDDPSKCIEALDRGAVNFRLTPDGRASRGGNWADGAITWSGFNTILPPNSPSCDTESQHRLEGVFSASSYHLDGCNVLYLDGAVQFVTNTIDTGDISIPSIFDPSDAPDGHPSPYGLWGSLGTIASESAISGGAN